MMITGVTSQEGNPSVTLSECRPLLELATREVFEMMLGTQLNPGSQSEPPRVPNITALVGLAGRINGVVSVRCEAPSACRMTAKMLGIPASEAADFDSSAFDAVGEICNMVAGNFKAKIPGPGSKCNLSIPTVVTGGDYRLHLLSVGEHTELSFDFEGYPIWVSLELRS
jgi:chemotaxis protein CheX